MLFVPPISDPHPFYIQFGTDTVVDITNSYKVVVKKHEYPLTLKAKEPYKNQWKDEHGDDEYIAPDGLKFEAFTFKMECAMFARALSEDSAISQLNAGIRAFQWFLSSGMFKTFDTWTGWGFQEVRLQEFQTPNEGDYQVWEEYEGGVNANSKHGCSRVIFTVVLKVNDPATHMVLSNGSIVEG